MRPPAGKLTQPMLVVSLLALDRASKDWARTSLAPIYEIKVLPFFSLSYVENTGAAWGMMQGNNTLLLGVSLALLGGLLVMRRTWKETEYWLHYGASLVIAGAVGNLYDRIAYKHVVDFLDFYWPGFYHWPVFNVADSAITVGAACLAWGLHLQDKAERAKQKA